MNTGLIIYSIYIALSTADNSLKALYNGSIARQGNIQTTTTLRTRTWHAVATQLALRLTSASTTWLQFLRTPRNTTCQMGFNVNMKFMNTGPPGLTSVSDRTRKFVWMCFPRTLPRPETISENWPWDPPGHPFGTHWQFVHAWLGCPTACSHGHRRYGYGSFHHFLIFREFTNLSV